MAIPSKYKLAQYQYGVQVRKGRQLYMMSEKKIYFGEWIIPNRNPIIIIEMSKQLADREALFYLEVNNHENIIRTFASVGNSPNLTIFIQEYAPQGDLADCLMDNQFQFTQPMLVQMFVQIANAMSHVASKNIVHGDLGCRNVLVFRVDPAEPRNNLVKITDFGLARWIEHPLVDEDKTIVPIRYCAPEILRNNVHMSYSQKSDVYSMGVLIWEALSNSEIPYSSIAKDDDVKQKKLNNEKLPQPQGSDRQLWVLMNNCWHKDPPKRPNFDEIKDRLSDMEISEVPNDSTGNSSHRVQIHCDYELDIDVKIKRLLNDGYPSIYEAQWISEEERPIVLIEKNEEPSEHEKLFYTTFKNHPHIVHTFGFVGNGRRSIMLLQERAPHGNLQSLLETGQFQPSASVLIEIFSQIINAMIDIGSQGFVHGDLCCENVLVFQMHPSDPKRNLVKLSNFTLTRPNNPLHTDRRQLFVPIRYCALEILRSAGHSNYSDLSDVYSMGVLMWQAFSKGIRPYDSSETNGEVRQRKLRGEKLPKPLLCHAKIWPVMWDCWHNEPQLRFEFKDMKTRFSHIDPRTLRRVPCRQCNNDIWEDELENHRQSCVPQIRPVNPIEQSDNDSDEENEPNSPPSIKRHSVVSSKPSIHDRRCKYCNESYPYELIEEHETLYCSKAFPPPPPVVKTEAEPLFKQCQYCNKKISNNKIADHQRICKPDFRVTTNQPIPSRPITTIQDTQQDSRNITDPSKESPQPKSRSLCARICSCLSFSN